MNAIEFAQAARVLAHAAQNIGLVVPGFRSPPKSPTQTRSLRRVGTNVSVAVKIKGRSNDEVCIDMVEGLLAVNNLDPNTDPLRDSLYEKTASLFANTQ